MDAVRTGSAGTPTPPAWAYLWWIAVGGLIGIGVASLLTIGLVFLLAGGVLGVIGSLLPALHNRSAGAALAGLGAAALFLAWLNRGGPGEVCKPLSDDGMSCVDAASPWPFMAVAAALVAGAVLLARRRAQTLAR